MRNGSRVSVRGRMRVRVRVMARAWVSSGLGLYFAAILRNFSQFYAFRIEHMQNRYGIKTRGGLQSVFVVMVTVSRRVYIMILFCRSIALFSVFYAFHIWYIPHSTIPHYTR